MREALPRSCGDGPFCRRAEKAIESTFVDEAATTEPPRALLTTSCTHALEMSALLLDIAPGDEVIVPSFTFVSTVNAFALRGARPIFADIRPDTLNLDESKLEAIITDKTRAIVPVHYGGVGCEMDVIVDLARRRNIAIVEDNAHGFLGRWRGKPLGTFGALATQSFHETKNFSCGEGGALVINDTTMIERAEILREKGTDRSRFFRGEVDKYTWVDLGSSYVLADTLGALLLAQLERREEIQRRRRLIHERYTKELAAWASAHDVRLPIIPAHCEQAYHLFYLLMPTLELRAAFIKHLDARDVHAVFHYQPLHLSPKGREHGGRRGDCPISERVADQLVRLPLFYGLDDDMQSRVVDAVLSFSFKTP